MVEDITVYAKWEDASKVKTTKVVFDLNGGDSAPIPEQEVPDRGRVAKPENPTKTGFDFVGWRNGPDGYELPFDFEKPVIYDAYEKWDHILKLKAFWQEAGTKQQVQVTFEFDGGTLPDGTVNRKTVTVDKGHPVANPGEPSYASRLFMYWYLDDMNAGPDKMYDFSLPVFDKCTLRARTKAKNAQRWMVTFMDGDTEWKSVQVEDGELCEKPTPDPVRAGYTFDYWCSDREHPDDSEFGFRVPIRKNLTLWAQWRRDPKVVLHKVIFDTQEAGKIDTVEVEDGKAVAEPAAPMRAGYDFKGWYTDKDCTTKYNFSTLVTSDTHLYAKWESNGKTTFNVTFHSNGGSEVPAQQVEENWKVQRPKNPVRAKHQFADWYEDAGLTKLYDFDTQVTKPLDLYAKWLSLYTVSYSQPEHGTMDVRNGSDPVASGKEVLEGTKLSVSLQAADNYKLKSLLVNGKEQKIGEDIEVREDVTLVAEFTLATYTVTFIYNDGVTQNLDTVVPIYTILQRGDDPQREGYRFKDWYMDQNLETPYDYSRPVKNDILSSTPSGRSSGR